MNRPTAKTLASGLLQLVLLALLFLALRGWLQRDFVTGAMPPITATPVVGETPDLESLRGQSWLLYVWADWCPVCKAQQSVIDALDADWPVLTIAMQSGSPQVVRDTLHQRGLSWITIADEQGRLAASLGVHAVPALFVVDGNGQIRFAERGYTTSLGLRARLWWSQWQS